MIKKKHKLLIGQVASAWATYPRRAAALRSMDSGTPILVTGMPRSGTTWVGHMLTTPGLWHVHEPFNPNNGCWNKQFTYLRPDEQSGSVDALMEKILSVQLRHLTVNWPASHWLMPLRLFKPPVQRILIKAPIASFLSEYITQRYGVQTIVLFRHPAAVVSSLLRLGWPYAFLLDQFLSCEELVEDWLGPYRGMIQKVAKAENAASAAVFYGCINVVLWGFAERNREMTVRQYEDLCANPVEKFKDLFQVLHLPYDETIKQKHIKLCYSPKEGKRDYGPHEVKRNTEDMVTRWRRHLSPQQLTQIRRIWDRFSVPLYKSEKEW